MVYQRLPGGEHIIQDEELVPDGASDDLISEDDAVTAEEEVKQSERKLSEVDQTKQQISLKS